MVKKVVLYVEGGGDSDSLHSECRKGFNKFLSKLGFEKKMPRIVACGSRADSFDRFKSACKRNSEIPVLLVDSETAILAENENGESDCWTPWKHLKTRNGDGWEKPENADDKLCHFMVECMESWLISDVDVLKKFYGQGFKEKEFDNISDIEKIRKNEIYRKLKEATKSAKTKGEYDKSGHSFLLLQQIDSNLVIKKSKWAKRFCDMLMKIMDSNK